MDTSRELILKDSGAGRDSKRRMRTIQEKREIVEETLQPGISVAVVARRHEVNANLVFGWRRLYQKGLLEIDESAADVTLVPVTVAASELRPKRFYRRRRKSVPVAEAQGNDSLVEIELAGGGRVRLHGAAAAQLLDRLARELCRG